jgi:hypothetical protein
MCCLQLPWLLQGQPVQPCCVSYPFFGPGGFDPSYTAAGPGVHSLRQPAVPSCHAAAALIPCCL